MYLFVGASKEFIEGWGGAGSCLPTMVTAVVRSVTTTHAIRDALLFGSELLDKRLMKH